MSNVLLQARGLGFRYGTRTVLKDIDLALETGRCTLISGDNGAGKSTLLDLLQGALKPSEGSVQLQGRPVVGQRRRIGLVRQHPSVNWHYPIDVAGLVGLPCHHEPGLTAQALKQTGLSGLAMAPLQTLSGGQRQRALIARVLTSGAELLLLDEPLTHLDQEHRNRLGQLIGALVRQGITVLFTAHGALPDTLQPDTHLVLQAGSLQEPGA